MISAQSTPMPPTLPAGGDEKIKKILASCAAENMGKLLVAKQNGGADQDIKNMMLSCLVEKIEKAAAGKGCSTDPQPAK